MDNLIVEGVSTVKITDTGATVISTTDSVLLGVILGNGSDASSALITDGNAVEIVNCSSGGTTANVITPFLPKFAISVPKGITLTLSGTDAYAYVLYRIVRA
jgi:hypothetical protein